MQLAGNGSPANGTRPGRRWLIGIFVVTLGIYAWATPTVLTYTEPPTGDQPFYLQTAISIVEDHDINEYNNYNESQSYNQFYPPMPSYPEALAYPAGFKGIPAPYPLPPTGHVGATKNRPADEWYSKHGLGVPVLIIPGWVIGKALTPVFAPLFARWTMNGGGGWPGTVFEFNILGALLAVQVFLFAWETTRRRGIALAVWAALAFSNPQMSYSLLIFPEMPAALLALYAFRRLNLGWAANRPWQLLLAGFCIGYIPWLHARFLPLTLVLALYALYQWLHARRDAAAPAVEPAALLPASPPAAITRPAGLTLGRLALALAPVVLSGLLLAYYYYWLYSSPLPNTQDHAGFFMPWLADDRLGLLLSVLGLFLDQQWGLLIYAPVFLLAVVGFFALWQTPAKRQTLGWLALLIVPYFAVVAEYRVWWGEWCPPARYLMVITPLLAGPLAQSLLVLRRSRAYGALYAGLGGLGVALMGGLIGGLSDRVGGQIPTFFNQPTGQASLFNWLAIRLHLNLINLLPGLVPWFSDHTRAIPWIPLVLVFSVAGLIVTTGLLLLDSARQRAEARVAFYNYIRPVPRRPA